MSLQVAKAAILSLAAVFCDVLPSYSLRLIDTEGATHNFSNEVHKTLQLERSLQRSYDAFLNLLNTACKQSQRPLVRKAAITAKCLLLQRAYSPAALTSLLQVLQTPSPLSSLSCR